MSDENVFPERRKAKRYQVKTGIFAIINKSSGQIIDISMNGLAFRYIAGEDKKNESSELTIYVMENSFLLEKFPFKVISDQDLNNKFNFSPIVMKRRSVQFQDLKPRQQAQLKDFITTYSLWEV